MLHLIQSNLVTPHPTRYARHLPQRGRQVTPLVDQQHQCQIRGTGMNIESLSASFPLSLSPSNVSPPFLSSAYPPEAARSRGNGLFPLAKRREKNSLPLSRRRLASLPRRAGKASSAQSTNVPQIGMHKVRTFPRSECTRQHPVCLFAPFMGTGLADCRVLCVVALPYGEGGPR